MQDQNKTSFSFTFCLKKMAKKDEKREV